MNATRKRPSPLPADHGHPERVLRCRSLDLQGKHRLLRDWLADERALLAARFAAPTSAGILFSMLIAAGLAGTWLYRKARILAIFDDLDTVLLMIPLKMMMVGFRAGAKRLLASRRTTAAVAGQVGPRRAT